MSENDRVREGRGSAVARLLVLSVLMLVVAAGCQNKPVRRADVGGRTIDLQRVQNEHMAYSNRFMTAMADLYDQLALNAPTDEGKAFALSRKISLATTLLQHNTLQNPMAGMIDSIVLVSIVRRTSEDPWYQEMYQEQAKPLVAMLRQYEQEGWERLGKYLTEEQVLELKQAIDAWREKHPDQRYVVATVDKDKFPDAIEISGGSRRVGSVFGFLYLDPLAGLDPAAKQLELSRETAERVFYYAQRLPTLVSWQADLTYRRLMLVPQTQQLLKNTERFSQASEEFSHVAEQFAASSEKIANSIRDFPAFVTEERNRTVRQVSAEVEIHRAAAIAELADAVAQERAGLLETADAIISRQRDAAAERFANEFGEKTNLSVENARLALNASIDHLFHRLVQLALLVFVLWLIAWFIKRRLPPINHPA